MERHEKLEKLADVLLMAAAKAEGMISAGKMDGRSYRAVALSKQIEGIALEFRAMAFELRDIDPSGERRGATE